jgi:long-chain acyl-CoA synthetase
MAEFSWLSLARRQPDEALLVSPTRRWLVADVLAELSRLMPRLDDSRVIGVLADNSPAWVMADLAIQEAGKVHLPLPAFFTAEQLTNALAQSGADTVLTDQPERIGALDLGFAITGHWQGLTWMRRVVDAVALPAGTAKISFTSGSTGTPKGVCLSADGLLDTAQAVVDRLADLPLGHHLAVLPLALLLENVAGVYAPLLRGLPVHLPPLASLGWRGMAGFDPAAFAAAVGEDGPGSLILVPELLKAWISFLGHFSRRPPESLHFVAVGGARVAPELLRAARGLGIPAYQGYGLTEAGSVITLNRPGDDGDGVGRPLAHAAIGVESGEVMVRSRAFLGYAGSPAPGDAEFATGDLGHLDPAGHLHLAGRRKNLLITSFGRNISPEWIEAALLASPAVAQCIVVGDGQPAPAAVIVTMPGATPAAIDATVAAVNTGLPDYARLAGWLPSPPFTADNGLATGNGRPRRQPIAERHAAGLAAIYARKETDHAVL